MGQLAKNLQVRHRGLSCKLEPAKCIAAIGTLPPDTVIARPAESGFEVYAERAVKQQPGARRSFIPSASPHVPGAHVCGVRAATWTKPN